MTTRTQQTKKIRGRTRVSCHGLSYSVEAVFTSVKL